MVCKLSNDSFTDFPDDDTDCVGSNQPAIAHGDVAVTTGQEPQSDGQPLSWTNRLSPKGVLLADSMFNNVQ